MSRKIDISHKTIFFVAGFLGLIWAIFLVRDLLILLFVAFIFVSALSPLVERLMKLGLPKTLSIALIYLVIFASIAAIITLGLTPITAQTSGLTERLTNTITTLMRDNHLDQNSLQQELPNLSHNLVTFTLDFFNSLITAALVAVITFYLLLDKERIENQFAELFVNKEKIHSLIEKTEIKLGAWLRGQLILSLIVGVFSYVGLTLLGVDYALPLAIISGLFEVVPIVGPILGAIPAILVALLTSPILALLTAILYVIVQQAESHVIVPQVMKRAVGLNPLLVIITIGIGSRLLGVAGALLAVPITVVLQIIVDDYLHPQIKL